MKKRAVIAGTKHPRGLMRAQVRILPEWNGVDVADLPWAEYQLPVGNAFVPTVTGDLVWVEFPYSDASGRVDTRRPVIVGAAQDAPGGVPNVAPEASGQGETWTPPGGVDKAPARPSLSATEDYVIHRNNILEVRTAGGGYEIANTASGARIGFNEAGELYIIATSGLRIHADGDLNVSSGGNVSFTASGQFSATASDFTFQKG